AKAHFNLGDALYQQQRFPESIQSYQLAAQLAESDLVKAKAYHNIGNAHMAQ
ncbi:MAG: tetratricopeptide repeat protein, partial [Bacteroidia bacterium]